VYDTIARIPDGISANEPDWELVVREWKSQTIGIVDYPTGEDAIDVCWRTLLRDQSFRDEKRLIDEDIEDHRRLFGLGSKAWKVRTRSMVRSSLQSQHPPD